MPTDLADSRMRMLRLGAMRAACMAAKRPAAPAPMMRMSGEERLDVMGWLLIGGVL